MDGSTRLFGRDIRVVAFPVLCAGATIAFVTVIQMTYRYELDQNPAVNIYLVQEKEVMTRGQFYKGFSTDDQLAWTSKPKERGVIGWLLSPSKEVDHTRINQTKLLHLQKEFLKFDPPLVISEKTKTRYLLRESPKSNSGMLKSLKSSLKQAPGYFSLEMDIVRELNLGDFTDGDRPSPFTGNIFFPSEGASPLQLTDKHKAIERGSQEGFTMFQSPLLRPKSAPQHQKMVVPSIVHVIWFNSPDNCTFRFHQFISLMSVHKFIRPQRIFFWHDNAPCGRWWNHTVANVSNIEMMEIEQPTSVFGHPVNVMEHRTDVLRISLVLRYGGIYIDLDIVVLKSWDQLLYYDTTLGAENPNLLGSGVILSAKAAKFMRLWFDSYRAFNDKRWNLNCCRIPMMIANRHPELIHIEWDTMHRPSWSELDYLYTPGKLWDWSVNYGVHLWYRFHKIEHSPDDIRTLNTTMGELFRYVYYGTSDFVPKV